MAYYFMVEKKKGEYQPIDISKSIYFQENLETRRLKKPCAYDLEEIDRFTMMFDNETELRERLVQEGTLPLEFFDKPLSIRFSRKNEYNKVPYGFLYQDNLEQVIDPTKIVEYIMKKYHENDFLLIKKIANLFADFRRCSSTAPEVRQLAEISIREGRRHPGLDEVDENGDKLVARLIKLIILENKDNYRTGKVEYTGKVNYRNLHVLLAFINHYNKDIDNELTQKKNKDKPNEGLTVPIFKPQPRETEVPTFKPAIEDKIEVKKRTRKKDKKNYVIDGQTSLFDV